MPGLTVAVLGIVACVAGHLWAEATGRPTARAVLKATASAAVVAVSLAGPRGPYASLILTGLLLSLAGDLFLLARARGAFIAGIGAFLLAHVAYAAAFAPASVPSPVVAVVLAALGAVVVRWLWPHLGPLRGPVVIYATAITAMLVLAAGLAQPFARVGAALFYASDLAVARDRFVRTEFANRVVGLPLYYAGQVLIALSTLTPP